MDAIRRFFIGAKHWQIFVIVVGLFCIAEIVALRSMAGTGDRVEITPLELSAAGVFWVFYAVWFWSMGSFLYSLVSPMLRPNLRVFRVALAYPIVYAVLFSVFFDRLTPILILAIFPFHLLALYCLFYDLNFVTKNLALAETGRVVSFYDYAGTFFLFGFFPLGIWFVQPRINRLHAAATNPASCAGSALRSE